MTRGEVDAALKVLEERGHSYKSEGALWLATTEFGDDKDRVLIRADGEPTYLTADSPITGTSSSAASSA